MRTFLLGLGLLPIGWVLFEVLGGRSSQEQYRSDEDLYTLLSLVGMLILAVGWCASSSAFTSGSGK
ncbi:hypothetical protein [Arthrobacter sp. Alg241-R88]|uniref:hypothetical protein n=1 Tax=Arthrobacter sp. Alg241-R88 TaxID=2305984 RepID=UPI0013D1CB7E|nr:hypothetical protein [Arthrobacter sp. Alg241-R88]